MISAQNLLLRSNGNRIAFCSIFILLLWIGCNPTKKIVAEKQDQVEDAERPKVFNPDTGQYEYADRENTKVDTIEWMDEVDPEIPIITDAELEKAIPYSELKSSYNISLLIPLRGSVLPSSQKLVSKLLERFIHYHKGFTLGLKKLEREGLNLKVNIIDIESTPLIGLTSNSDLLESDLIIGPYRREHIEKIAPIANEYKIPMVTPWNSYTNLAEVNPYMILPSPGFEIYCRSIVEDVLNKHDPRDVRIVLKEGDEYLYNFFHQFTEPSGIQDTSQSFKTYLVNDTTLELSETPVDSHLVEDRNNVFIIPYYRSSDQRFVYSFLRRLSIGNLNYEIFVYGMPQWKNWVELDYDLYNSMKIYIPSTGITNKESWDYQQIRDAFVGEFGMLPTDPALEAYDLIVLMGRMLFKYGKNFQYYLGEEIYEDSVYSGYRFFQLDPPLTTRSIDDRMLSQPGFENRFVQLIQLKDYTFQKVN